MDDTRPITGIGYAMHFAIGSGIATQIETRSGMLEQGERDSDMELSY